MEAILLSREDFLDEIRIAPKWNIFHHAMEGCFELVVFYSFGSWAFKSPGISSMVESESKYFYKTLAEVVTTPSIAEVKVQ